MNGRQRIKSAIKCGVVDRVPWVPFVGCHAGQLIGVKATEYLKSTDLMVKGIEESIRRYRPDGIPVAFDLQLEAEVLGCKLVWADENPPAVASHPLEEGVKLESLKIPSAGEGRIAATLEVARRLRKAHPDLALYGLVTGPFTLAMHLAGTSLFMKMFEGSDEVHSLMKFCRSVAEAMTKYYLDAGCDVVAVVDPMTSQIGPDQFAQFVTPYVAPLFDTIRATGALGSFFVCGQAQQNIEVMCDCRPDNVSIDENIPLDYVRDVCVKRGISFGGNLQLTVVLLLGTVEDSQRNAVACLETGGERGFILAPGCDLPYATPSANLEAVADVAQDPYKRSVAKALGEKQSQGVVFDMTDYGKSDRVIVDIITLDSESCAPCQYMVESVKAVVPEFEGIVEWREHKIKYRESLVFMTSLMVKNIPTICIDGKITFVSRIPPKEELIAAIQKRIIEKLRFRIRQKRGAVYVLGRSAEECEELRANVETAVRELGADVSVSVVTDRDEIASYGVVRTPSVVLARYQVKAEGRVPGSEVIREWLKETL